VIGPAPPRPAAQLETDAHAIAAVAFQRIQPFTDLLIHDLGDGLADGRPDFLGPTGASGARQRSGASAWCRPSLPGAAYLHDGRARTVAEAILWHGGEAEAGSSPRAPHREPPRLG